MSRGDDRSPSERRRLERLASRRRLRRQRALLASALVLGLAAAGTAIGVLTTSGSSSHKRSPNASPRPPIVREPTPRPERPTRSLGGAEQAALRRFARLGRLIYCGGRRRREVALTFDDGPGPYSAYALRVLRRAHAHATFFLVGKELAYWPRIPRLEESLAAIGDHTWHHVPLTGLGVDAMHTELSSAKRAIGALVGEPIQLFRPPYGETDPEVTREARALGMVEVLWSVDSSDSWPGATAARIAARVKRLIRPGSVVLLHENRGQTLEALRFQILPYLLRRHLRLVTVPYLLATDPPSLTQLRAGYAGCT